MDLKERLIKETAKEKGISEALCKKIINHQFSCLRAFMHSNEVGEIHIPRIGKLTSTEGGVNYIKKKLKEKIDLRDQKEKKGEENNND